MARFDGKVALLTGAASGIGRATTLRLASEGAQVFAVDIDEAGLASTAELVASAGGAAVATARVDVSQRDACHAVVAECVARFGRLDVLGNIAGIAQAVNFTELTQELWDRMSGVNIAGCLWMSQAAIPHLIEAEGNIVNIASNAGLMGCAYTVPYCVTKGGVVQLTRALAMEYVKTKLRVNAIAPGGVNTALVQNYAIPEGIDFDLMAPYVGFRPMAEAEDIASMFAYLASDEARSVHGAIHSVDNGLTAG